MLNIKLSHIEDLRFHLNTEYDYSSLNVNSLNIRMNNKLKFNPNIANFILSLDYVDSNDVVLMSQTVSLDFLGDFSNYDTNSTKEELKPLMIQFMSVAIGTIRGIIAVKTKNKPLSNYPLPLIGTSYLEQSLDQTLVEKSIE